MNLEEIKIDIEGAVPGARLEVIQNPAPAAQHSLLVDSESAVAVAIYLRDASHLRLDYCSNVTGIDWLPKENAEKIKVKTIVDGVEQEIEEVRKTTVPGYLEVVYHLFSTEKRTGPLPIRMRTLDREQGIHLPSLTPVWRSAEFQEREVFDLFGVVFDGHPDLRRLLMWNGFTDYPMRRDYVDADDYEYEPTAHDEVLRRANAHLTNAEER